MLAVHVACHGLTPRLVVPLSARYTPHWSIEEYLSSKLPDLTTTSYAILGLLTIKPWSTYELAKQMQRAFSAPRGELFHAEPKKLIAHGCLRPPEPRGKQANRLLHHACGRTPRRLARKPAAEPRWEAESMVKFTFATGGSKEQLLANLRDFRRHASFAGKLSRRSSVPISRATSHSPTERTSTSSREDSSLRPHASKLSGQTGRSKGPEMAHTAEPQDHAATLAALKAEIAAGAP